METIYVSREEMVDTINRYYIVTANSDEDYIAIWKTIKGNWITTKKLVSKDGKYEICVSRHNRVGIINAKDYNWIWVHDREADNYYEYRAIFYGKFKREIKAKITARKQNRV